jgi:cytochrome c oxidase subunit III
MTDYVADGRRLRDVPHTTEARSAAEVSRAAGQRYGPPAALWGMLILIASEGMLFASMIGAYFYLRFTHHSWPPPGDPKPKALFPLVLVACLALTSIPMQLASNGARAGRLAAARLLIVVALVVQAGYLAYAIHDYRDQLATMPISRDAYSSIYYTLLGADHAHVAIGILFSVWLLWKLARGLTTYRLNATQGITWYWHFVNALTVIVILVLLSVRL